eukprot:PhM_4_TR1145/c0_g1_i1/m.61815/K01148/PARN, PNLDC1; poly(A)-specific ribonuclease
MKSCEFIAFDEEMTGISFADEPESILHPLPKSYDLKRRAAEKFSLIQVGLCLFEKDPSSDDYITRPFNFYVFPLTGRVVVLEPSGVDFNRRNNMDYQRWIYEGLGYCTEAVEKEYDETVAAAMANEGKVIELVSDADKELAASLLARIDAWYRDSASPNDLVMPPTQSRVVRTHVEQVAPKQCDNKITMGWKARSWTATRLQESPEVIAARDALKANVKRLSTVGFREVYKLLVEAKKPMVGHNVFSDFLFLLSSCDSTLPESMEDFRSLMVSRFGAGGVWDTKILASADKEIEAQFEHTGLQRIFETLIAPDGGTLRGIRMPLGFERYSELLIKKASGVSTSWVTLAHEAAYDALCTGYVFIRLREQYKAAGKQDAFDTCRNLIAIFRSLYGFDVNPDSKVIGRWLPRTPVLGLTFPKGVRDVEVQASLAPLKGEIPWPEETAAVLHLAEGEDVEAALKHYNDPPNKKGIRAVLLEPKGIARSE